MQYYLESVENVFKDVNSTPDGLSSSEASARLEKNGPNKLNEAKKDSTLKKFFDQMKDPMIIILIIAAAISAVTEFIEHGLTVPTDTLIILAVVLINAILGVIQENKAEKAVEALQKMSAATTKTLRDGKVVTVKSEDLVVGDVILLDAGDAIPADCRIFECASMKIEEAALTGESVPVNKLIGILTLDKEKSKEIPLGDRKNMAYMGSTLVYGRGKAVVTGTGMNTEMGKIANAISLAEEGKTPLEIKLEQLSKVLTKLVIAVCVIIFGYNIAAYFLGGAGGEFYHVALDSFITAIALAVAAIPEGLVAVMTIVLSIGVTNMSKKNAIIRKMNAVETLGCTQIICSDKTGTLTQNVMTVVDHYAEDEKLLATAMALCTNAEVDEDGKSTGEPDEVALINYASLLGLKKADLVAANPRVGEVPFDSGRKMMSTVHSVNGKYIQYTKGAPDEILKKCTKAFVDGQIVELNDEILANAFEENTRMGNKALRVFAVAFKEYTDAPTVYEAAALENEMIFIGLTGMIDPVRPEVKAAIVECRGAGITPIMITGDHINTAKAIARELGILTDDSQAMMGSEIDKYSDEEFEKVVENIFVYARVQPEHKTRIVNAWRNKGYVTAMTGDGVNDAPSIKSADIGVGMGITGTDVTKNVADMVLTDDNFATIVSAVGEGRRIYDNIRKAIQFLLSSNLSEVISIFFATIMSFTILQAPHLLFINLVTDSIPALALGLEKPEKNIMKRKPRSKNDGIFAGGLGFDCAYQGILVSILTIAAFYIGEFLTTGHFVFTNIADCKEGMTMAFFTMAMCEIFHSFNMRSQRQSSIGMVIKGHHNVALYAAMIGSFLLTTAVVEIDFLSGLFGFAHLNLTQYLISLGLAFLVIPIVEVVKLIQRKTAKNID